jgi:putative ABC transport system ATP-binding protein
MIRIESLTKAFLDGARSTTVLQGLDLELAPGDFVALLGRSGSGKSTLLNCIAGIETPDSGRVLFDDVDITRLPDRDRTRLRRDRIGIVFQFFNLLPMIPVLENVALPALLRGDKRADALARAHALLEELGLADRASEMPDRLSGGEQQRVATARALINRPALLLADEPTGNLDASTAERTLALLREVNEKHGVTVLMVTHSDEAAATAKRVAHLVGGRIEWPPQPRPATEPEPEPRVEPAAKAAPAPVVEPSRTADGGSKVHIQIPTDTGEKKMKPSAKAAALFGNKPDPPAQSVDEIIERLSEDDLRDDDDAS